MKTRAAYFGLVYMINCLFPKVSKILHIPLTYCGYPWIAVKQCFYTLARLELLVTGSYEINKVKFNLKRYARLFP